jgi:hypothetical protein
MLDLRYMYYRHVYLYVHAFVCMLYREHTISASSVKCLF